MTAIARNRDTSRTIAATAWKMKAIIPPPFEDHFIPEPITTGGMSACFVSTGGETDDVEGLPSAVDKVSGVDGRQAVEYYYRYTMVFTSRAS